MRFIPDDNSQMPNIDKKNFILETLASVCLKQFRVLKQLLELCFVLAKCWKLVLICYLSTNL